MIRYDMCFTAKDINGNDIVIPRGFFRYQDLDDNIPHYAKDGEMLWEIAAFYYQDVFPHPSLWYYAIADFQPDPILDSTLMLEQGTVIYVPSARTIQTMLLDPDREPEYERF